MIPLGGPYVCRGCGVHHIGTNPCEVPVALPALPVVTELELRVRSIYSGYVNAWRIRESGRRIAEAGRMARGARAQLLEVAR